MDPEAFLDLANQVTKIKPFPYLDIAHCALACYYVREDLGSGSLPFSRKHPLACWLSSMVSIFAGGIVASALLGEPVLGVFKNNNQFLVATLVWYLIFYSPFDIVYKACKFLPVKLVLSAMKEVYRCKKVHDGVAHAAKAYPTGYFAMIAIGVIKGNGSGFLKIGERLMRGVWTPSTNEVLVPSFPTKACIAAAFFFVLDKKTDYISAPHSLVYFGVVIFFVYFKLSSILLGIHDPFVPFENMFCTIFMGGAVDSLQRVVGANKEGDAAKNDAPAEKEKVQKKKD